MLVEIKSIFKYKGSKDAVKNYRAIAWICNKGSTNKRQDRFSQDNLQLWCNKNAGKDSNQKGQS